MTTFSVKNFERFQHYKDRAPPWIKLYNELLENYEFGNLPDEQKGQLIGIWLLASRMDNKLPYDPAWIGSKINASSPVDLEALADSGFIVASDTCNPKIAEQVATAAQRRAKENGFGSRHISDEVKRIVWQRDKGRCCDCGSSDRIEYDHKHPVSKGGTSTEDNIQLLCRTCNRRKRARVATPAERVAAHAEHVATQRLGSRTLEREGETEESREEKETPPVAKATRGASEKFEEFWKERPRRDGDDPRKPAEKKFNALVKTGVDPDVIISGAKMATIAAKERGVYGTKFVPQTVKWLNDQRFADYAAEAYSAADQSNVDDEAFWDSILTSFKRFGHWSGQAGPGLDSPGCKVPDEMLAKHGLSRTPTVTQTIDPPRLKSMGDLH